MISTAISHLTVRRTTAAAVRVTMMAENAEYSTKVKMTAETRAPLRQARLFFLYPSTLAGASLATYVSLIRAISGQGEGLSDVINTAINLGVIAAAIYFFRGDLKGRSELLEEVAIELGERERPPPAADAGDPAEE